MHPNNEFPANGDYIYYAVSTDRTPGIKNRNSNILLVGNQNETTVSITPSQTVSLPEDTQNNSNLVEVAAGATHNVTLNGFQTLGFLHSSRPHRHQDCPLINLSLSSLDTNVHRFHPQTGFCEPMYVHMLPTFNWGQQFLLGFHLVAGPLISITSW